MALSTVHSRKNINHNDEVKRPPKLREINVLELRVKQTLVLPDLCKIMSIFTPKVDTLIAVVEQQPKKIHFSDECKEITANMPVRSPVFLKSKKLLNKSPPQ